MGQFQLKKSDLWLKFALFDSKSQNLQIRQWVALFLKFALFDPISRKFSVALFGVPTVDTF